MRTYEIDDGNPSLRDHIVLYQTVVILYTHTHTRARAWADGEERGKRVPEEPPLSTTVMA